MCLTVCMCVCVCVCMCTLAKKISSGDSGLVDLGYSWEFTVFLLPTSDSYDKGNWEKYCARFGNMKFKDPVPVVKRV